MSSLNELGLKHGTDKSTASKSGESSGHDYLRIYEKFFEPYRDTAVRVLEVGVLGGSSLRTWEEYFPNATIYGLDIKPASVKHSAGRVDVRIMDQSDVPALEAFAEEAGPFDIVIEDGSHIWSHQIIGMKTLMRYVAPGGVYVVEDLQTSYVARYATPGGGPTAVEFLMQACERKVGDRHFRAFPEADAAFMDFIVERVDYIALLRRAAAFFLRA